MILDQTGSLAGVKRHDYLPFGEELFANTGVRTATLGYSGGDGARQQFTSQERDTETGLDYFGARYYASVQGAFTSADPIGGRKLNPQTLNRYSYVTNSPLRYVDPSGLYPQDPKCPDCINTEDKPEIVRINSAKPSWFKRAWQGIKKFFSDTAKDVGQQAIIDAGARARTGQLIAHGVLTVAPVAREIIESNPEFMGGRIGEEIPVLDSLAIEAADEEMVLIVEELNATAGVFPVLRGQAGVERAIAEYEAEGGSILGREITIDTSAARTRLDFVGRNKAGELEFVEVKNGPTARLSTNQELAIPVIRAQGGIPRGANAIRAGLDVGKPLPPTPVRIIQYK
jgi:RHS repeat-associated protein